MPDVVLWILLFDSHVERDARSNMGSSRSICERFFSCTTFVLGVVGAVGLLGTWYLLAFGMTLRVVQRCRFSLASIRAIELLYQTLNPKR